MKKIIKAVVTVLYAIAVIVLVVTVFCTLLNVRPAVVMSGSMEPTIETGSIIVINERDRDVKRGDIIAFKIGDIAVAHRVVDVQDDKFITKGDNNKSVDTGIVTSDMIEGTVIFHIPEVGYAVKWLGTMPGMISIFIAAAVVMLIGYLVNKEEIGEEKE